jgi:hypothetical protein
MQIYDPKFGISAHAMNFLAHLDYYTEMHKTLNPSTPVFDWFEHRQLSSWR